MGGGEGESTGHPSTDRSGAAYLGQAPRYLKKTWSSSSGRSNPRRIEAYRESP